MTFKECLKLVIFLLTLWGYPFVASWIINPQYSQTITVPYRFAIVVGTLVFGFISLRKFNWNKGWLFNGLSIFILLYSVRILNDVLSNPDTLTRTASTFLSLWFLVSVFPSLIFIVIDYTPQKGRQYLLFSLIVCALTLFQLLYQINNLSSYLGTGGRLSLAAINPISIGHVATSTIILSFYCLLNSQVLGQSRTKNIFLYIALALGLYFLFFAASRGPLIATVTCLSLLFFTKIIPNGSVLVKKYIFNLSKIKLRYFFLIIFIVGCLPVIFQKLTTEGVALERLMSYNDDYEIGGFLSRNRLISLALSSIFESNNLALGAGLELKGLGYPHNLLVEALLATGIIGASIFTIVFLGCIVKSMKILLKSDSWGWLALIYFQYALAGMFSGSLYASNVFWYLTFAIACFPLKQNVYRQQVNTRSFNILSLSTMK